jgi:hypothetical protein
MLVKRFGWCAPVERLAWSAVERCSDRLELLVCLARFVPLGKYWRSRPLVFSFVPRCHGR